MNLDELNIGIKQLKQAVENESYKLMSTQKVLMYVEEIEEASERLERISREDEEDNNSLERKIRGLEVEVDELKEQVKDFPNDLLQALEDLYRYGDHDRLIKAMDEFRIYFLEIYGVTP